MGNVGTQDRYAATGNINVKESKFNFTMMYSLNATMTGTTFGYTNQNNYDYNIPGNTLAYQLKNSTLTRNRFQFARASMDYNINNRNNIGISYNFVKGLFYSDDRQIFSTKDNSGLIDTWGTRQNINLGGFTNNTAQLTYRKTFPTPGKELTADVTYNQGGGPATFTYSTYNSANIGGTVYEADPVVSQNNGKSTNNMYTAQLDFVNPIAENKKIEAGFRLYRKQTLFDNNIQNKVFPTGDFVKDTIQSTIYSIDDMVNAAYFTYTGKGIWDLGYQGGIRFEETHYSGKLLDKNVSFGYDYPSNKNNILFAIFPSLYLSKKIAGKHEFQFNMSRKIERPNFFQVMPYIMYSDARNYRIGNPTLKPELLNIGEINYNNSFKKGNWLSSAYIRYSQQPISTYLYPSPTNASITVNTFANGKDQFRYGFENTFRVNWTKKFTTTINADVFYVYLNSGVINGAPETVSKGWSYKGKIGLNYTLPWNLQLQVNGNYEAPKAILNGRSRELYFMDISLNKMIGTKWIFNAMLSDVFNTKQYGYYISMPNYYQEVSRRRETRFVRFTITYLFGKFDTSIFKKMGKKGGGSDQSQGQGGDGF